MWYRVNRLAKKYGVTRITIGNWIRQGKFSNVERTKGGHYRVWVDDASEKIGYVRVSSSKQKSSLESQRRLILESHPGIRIVSDVGSGFNFRRAGFRSLLERCLQGTPICIVVTTSDRLTRSGFQFIKWAVELHGGSITELEESSEQQEFDAADLVRFVTCFIASYHGRRSARRKKNQGVSGGRKSVERPVRTASRRVQHGRGRNQRRPSQSSGTAPDNS